MGEAEAAFSMGAFLGRLLEPAVASDGVGKAAEHDEAEPERPTSIAGARHAIYASALICHAA